MNRNSTHKPHKPRIKSVKSIVHLVTGRLKRDHHTDSQVDNVRTRYKSPIRCMNRRSYNLKNINPVMSVTRIRFELDEDL